MCTCMYIQARAFCHRDYFNICISLMCNVEKKGGYRQEPRVRGESSCSWWKLIIKSLNQPPLWQNFVVQILVWLRIAVNHQNLYSFVMNLWSVQKEWFRWKAWQIIIDILMSCKWSYEWDPGMKVSNFMVMFLCTSTPTVAYEIFVS